MRTRDQLIEAALHDLLTWAEAQHIAAANTDGGWPDEIVEAQRALMDKKAMLSTPMLAVLRAAPIQATMVPPKRTWTFYVGKRAVTTTVNHLLSKGLLSLHPNGPGSATATLTEAGHRSIYENRLF